MSLTKCFAGHAMLHHTDGNCEQALSVGLGHEKGQAFDANISDGMSHDAAIDFTNS